MKKEYLAKIVNAQYIDGYNILLTFADGTQREIDFGVFLLSHPHPAWDKYREIKNFKKFYIDSGNIVWGKHSELIFDEYKLYKGKNPK
jgi:hypothetical protein